MAPFWFTPIPSFSTLIQIPVPWLQGPAGQLAQSFLETPPLLLLPSMVGTPQPRCSFSIPGTCQAHYSLESVNLFIPIFGTRGPQISSCHLNALSKSPWGDLS